MTIMLATLAALASPADLQPIKVPYQIVPVFMEYTNCVTDRVAADRRSKSADGAVVQQSNSDALLFCKSVRDEQLKRALELQTDTRLYGGSVRKAQDAVREAFDRFDAEYEIDMVETK